VLFVDRSDDDGVQDAARRDVVEDLEQRNFRIGKEDVDAKSEVLESALDHLGVETLLLVHANNLAIVFGIAAADADAAASAASADVFAVTTTSAVAAAIIATTTAVVATTPRPLTQLG